jgi:glycosyltransferase involved in cell wall biosynthesis
MKILMITNNDPAGMGIAFANAINRHTEHSARLITLDTKYNTAFETDIHLPDIADDDFSEVESLLKTSDVLHFHIMADENMLLGPLLIRDYIKGKRVLHHHHGHPNFIVNAGEFAKKYKRLGRRAAVSTPDLLKVLPGSVWLPNLVPINDVQFMPWDGGEPESDRVRVCQAPTRKFHKDSKTFMRVMENIISANPHVELRMIENTGYFECLQIKRTMHIVFDHMQGHFGISSLESLSQGKPVIAGLDDWNIEQIKRFTGADHVPWVVARDEEQLHRKISELVEDRALRLETGRKAREHMEKYWTEQHAIKVLLNLYKELPTEE